MLQSGVTTIKDSSDGLNDDGDRIALPYDPFIAVSPSDTKQCYNITMAFRCHCQYSENKVEQLFSFGCLGIIVPLM